MTLRDIERILYFEAYVLIDPGMTQLERGQLLSEEAYYDAIEDGAMNLMHVWVQMQFKNCCVH